MIRSIWLLSLALPLSACDGTRSQVYVPASTPDVVLDVRATPAVAKVGQTVELHAERHYQGEWHEVDRTALKNGQCWLSHPPPGTEREVADKLQWVAVPPEGVHFGSYRGGDHAQQVSFLKPGVYVLQPRSPVWCGSGTAAVGPSVTVAVR